MSAHARPIAATSRRAAHAHGCRVLTRKRRALPLHKPRHDLLYARLDLEKIVGVCTGDAGEGKVEEGESEGQPAILLRS